MKVRIFCIDRTLVSTWAYHLWCLKVFEILYRVRPPQIKFIDVRGLVSIRKTLRISSRI